MKRKIFSFLLSVAMIMTMLPLTVGAKAAPNEEILNSPPAIGNVTISELATRLDSASNVFDVTFKVQRQAVLPRSLDSSFNLPEIYLLTIPLEKNIRLVTEPKNFPLGTFYISINQTIYWNFALKAGDSATLSYRIKLSADKKDFGRDMVYPLNSPTKTILSFGCKTLAVNVPTVKYSWPTLSTRGYLVNEIGKPINAAGQVVSSIEKAVVVYDETPIINPIVNKNEWLYGPHDVSANKVFGYTLADKSPKRITLSEKDQKGVAWFAYKLNKKNYTVEYYFEDSSGKFNKNDTLSKTGDFKLNETKNASDFVLKDVPAGFTYDPQNANAINSISYTQSSKTGNVLKLYYKQKVHKLTIHYVDKNGKDIGNAAPTYTDSSKHYEDAFSVTSPTINGFTADKTVIEGKMPDADAEFTVVYTVNSYPLTVNYVDENGKSLAASVKQSYDFGDKYTVTSPAIAGFELKDNNQGIISGTMSEKVTVDVVYKQKVHKLTIHYVDKDGKDIGNAAPTYTDSSKHYTDPFSVTSPTINGFTADKTVIDGKMPDADANFTVIYTAVPAPTPSQNSSSSSAQPTAIVNNTVPKTNSPQTGDSGSFVLASMLLAAVSLTGIVMCKKRGKTK